jgi:hypothetical protein
MIVPVFVEEWQLACCGEPFAVGDRVAWEAEPSAAPPGFESVAGVLPDGMHGLFFEDHHDVTTSRRPVAGTVRRIRVVCQSSVWSEQHRGNVPSGDPIKLRAIERSHPVPFGDDVRGLLVDVELA